MAIGIRTFFQKIADTVFTSSATFATVGLESAIAAGQTQKLRYWIPFSVGATGGVRARLDGPGGATVVISSMVLYNTVAPSITTATQTALGSALTNALANAGTHWLEINATVVNGAAAGTVVLEMAQNTVDVLSLTVLRGGTLEVIKS